MKKSTYSEKTAAAVCNRLLTAARRGNRKAIYNSWTDSRGRCCMTDGYRAYRLPHAPNGLSCLLSSKVGDFQPMPADWLDSIWMPYDAGTVEEMPAPDENAVKAFIDANTIQQGKRRVYSGAVYDLGERLPVVDAKYLLDIIRLFPGAKWYVLADCCKRMLNPIFITSEHGDACLLPIRTTAKRRNAPEAEASKPEDRPQEDRPQPERVEAVSQDAPEEKASAAADWLKAEKYFVYAKLPGENRYYLADLSRGTYRLKKMLAPMVNKDRIAQIEKALDSLSAENPGVSFQIRTPSGKVKFTTAPTYTPETFAAKFAA